MNELNNLVCRNCASKHFIPVLYGTKDPKRDHDLVLQEKLVIHAGFRRGLGSPLWACGRCLSLLDARGVRLGESEGASHAHATALERLFDAYTPLEPGERRMLMGRTNLRRLLEMLDRDHATEFELVGGEDGASLRRKGESHRLYECDREMWRQIVHFASTHPKPLRSGGSSWKVLHQQSDGLGEVVSIRSARARDPR